MTPDLIACPDAERFPLGHDDVARVRAAGLDVYAFRGHTLESFAEQAEEIVAALAWGGQYGEAFFAALPRLRVLARCGAGVDNIDRGAAAAHGVQVTYVPGASDDEVAEHTLALVLALARKLVPSDRAVRAGGWPSSVDLAPTRRLRGQRLGLVGFGKIARAVATRAVGLGLVVRAVDPAVEEPRFADNGVERCSDLPELLALSDIVSLHCGYQPGSPPLIGAGELATLPPGAVLVNTARGRLVDEDALAAALRSGHLSGAGVDVYAEEPLAPASPLRALESVVLTPHSAAFSTEALSEIRCRALDDALTVLSGRPARDPLPEPR